MKNLIAGFLLTLLIAAESQAEVGRCRVLPRTTDYVSISLNSDTGTVWFLPSVSKVKARYNIPSSAEESLYTCGVIRKSLVYDRDNVLVGKCAYTGSPISLGVGFVAVRNGEYLSQSNPGPATFWVYTGNSNTAEIANLLELCEMKRRTLLSQGAVSADDIIDPDGTPQDTSAK